MNFKKIFSYVMSAALICGVFVGCGGSQESAETTNTTTAATTAATQAKAEYEAGTRTDKEYSSKWFGIKYTLPEGYIMMTDDQLKQAMQIGADNMYEDSSTGEQLINYAELNTIYEMSATSATTGESVIIIAEKMAISFNENQYAQAFKEQLKNTTITPIYKDTTTRDVAGITFTDVSYSFTQNGMKLHQTVLFKQYDDRMFVMTFTYTSEDSLDTMLKGFAEFK